MTKATDHPNPERSERPRISFQRFVWPRSSSDAAAATVAQAGRLMAIDGPWDGWDGWALWRFVFERSGDGGVFCCFGVELWKMWSL